MTLLPDLATTIAAVKADAKPRMARCPGHDDSTPSLSVGLGKKGGVVLYCQAGCKTPDILTAVGLTSADIAAPKAQAPTIADTYDYSDEHNALLYQVVRYLPKDFRQRRPDGVGGWIWKVGKEVRRVLFGLPTLAGQATRSEPRTTARKSRGSSRSAVQACLVPALRPRARVLRSCWTQLRASV
jgi:hypothetical protein